MPTLLKYELSRKGLVFRAFELELAGISALWWSFVWASMFIAAAFRARSLLDVSRLSTTTGLGGTESSAGVGASAPPPRR